MEIILDEQTDDKAQQIISVDDTNSIQTVANEDPVK